MICFSDNDVIKKLAICNLLDEAVAALLATHREVFILPTAKYALGVARHPERTKAMLGDAAFDRLAAFLDNVQEVASQPSDDELRLFDDAVGIDAGEAVLFSATSDYDDFILATGDKRSLRGLASLPSPNPVIERLSGRIICFEQVVVRIVNRIGFEEVRQRVVPASDCDTVLRAVFGSGLQAVEENARGSFAAYIRHLRDETGSLLVAE